MPPRRNTWAQPRWTAPPAPPPRTPMTRLVLNAEGVLVAVLPEYLAAPCDVNLINVLGAGGAVLPPIPTTEARQLRLGDVIRVPGIEVVRRAAPPLHAPSPASGEDGPGSRFD